MAERRGEVIEEIERLEKYVHKNEDKLEDIEEGVERREHPGWHAFKNLLGNVGIKTRSKLGAIEGALERAKKGYYGGDIREARKNLGEAYRLLAETQEPILETKCSILKKYEQDAS
jgi:hypothetical protein